MASVVARQGRSESFKSKVSGQRNREAVVGASDEGQLASALKEKVASGGKSTPAKELLKSLAAGGIQPSRVPVNEARSGSKTKGKGKITVQQPAAAMSSVKQTPEQKKMIGKITVQVQQPAAEMSSVEQTPEQKKLIVKEKMKKRYGGIGKASVEPDGEMHLIVMDKQEFQTAASLIDHTCQKGIDCKAFYTQCSYKEEAARIHFKKFLVKTFGRYGVRLFWGSWFGYNKFLCLLTEEQAEILRGEEGVKDVKIQNQKGRWG